MSNLEELLYFADIALNEVTRYYMSPETNKCGACGSQRGAGHAETCFISRFTHAIAEAKKSKNDLKRAAELLLGVKD